MDGSILAQSGWMNSEQFVTGALRSILLAFMPAMRQIPARRARQAGSLESNPS